MPQYKLTYFNIRWLGEGARVLFHYAGVPFEDVRVNPQQWAELKPCCFFFFFSYLFLFASRVGYFESILKH